MPTKPRPKKPTPPPTPPGSLRVWWIPPGGVKAFRYPVADLAQAKFALAMLAGYDAFLDAHRATTSSTNGLEVFWEDGKWREWHNADGNDIRWIMAQAEAV